MARRPQALRWSEARPLAQELADDVIERMRDRIADQSAALVQSGRWRGNAAAIPLATWALIEELAARELRAAAAHARTAGGTWPDLAEAVGRTQNAARKRFWTAEAEVAAGQLPEARTARTGQRRLPGV